MRVGTPGIHGNSNEIKIFIRIEIYFNAQDFLQIYFTFQIY